MYIYLLMYTVEISFIDLKKTLLHNNIRRTRNFYLLGLFILTVLC